MICLPPPVVQSLAIEQHMEALGEIIIDNCWYQTGMPFAIVLDNRATQFLILLMFNVDQ